MAMWRKKQLPKTAVPLQLKVRHAKALGTAKFLAFNRVLTGHDYKWDYGQQ